MINLSAALFPHTTVKYEDLKRILFLFSPVTICQPWYMKAPAAIKEFTENAAAKVLYPPENTKPEHNVTKLLLEYETWINQLDEGNYADSLKAAKQLSIAEEHSWDISKNIRGFERGHIETSEIPELEWHIMLHLARKLEESRADADELLNRVKRKSPPLQEALEGTAAAPGLFNDLPESDSYAYLGEHQIVQIIEAWVGLFSSYLDDFGILVTSDPNVMNTVTSAFEERNIEKNRPCVLLNAHITIPDTGQIEYDKLFEIKEKFFNERASNALGSLVSELSKHKNCEKEELLNLTEVLQGCFPPDLTAQKLSVDMVYLEEFSTERSQKNEFDHFKLGGKIIAFFQEENKKWM